MSLQSILELFGKKEEEQAASAVLWDGSGSSAAGAAATDEVLKDLDIMTADVQELTSVGGSGDEAVVALVVIPKKQRLVKANSQSMTGE
ncbi:hypothetical protein Dimus_026582, partial [Dionaea muscipula]